MTEDMSGFQRSLDGNTRLTDEEISTLTRSVNYHITQLTQAIENATASGEWTGNKLTSYLIFQESQIDLLRRIGRKLDLPLMEPPGPQEPDGGT